MAYAHSAFCVSPKMTAYDAPSPNVVTESNYSSSNRGWKAFKQLDSGDPWYYNSTAGNQWIKLDLGSGNSAYVNSYTLSSTPNNGSYPGMPTAWRLEGSDNNSDWTELDYRSGIAAWGGSTMRTYMAATPGTYRYFRITFITKEGGSAGWQVDEIELLNGPYVVQEVQPTMTAYAAPSPNVVTESNYSSAYRGWKAFNKVSGDPWYYNSTAANQWIKLDFGSGNAVLVNAYRLTSNTNNSGYPGMPVEWTVEGSNNDSDWTQLDSRSGIAAWPSSTTREYWTSSAAAYRYYRFTFVTKESGSSGWQLDEITLLLYPTAIQISKAAAYSVLTYPGDTNIAKALAYAVLSPAVLGVGIDIAKAQVFAVLRPGVSSGFWPVILRLLDQQRN